MRSRLSISMLGPLAILVDPKTRDLFVRIRAQPRADLDPIRLLAEAMAEVEQLQTENRELKARNLRLEAEVIPSLKIARRW